MSVPPPSEVETGVSNGDVDWLFRGKSKKLSKKSNSESRASNLDKGDVPVKQESSQPSLQPPQPPSNAAESPGQEAPAMARETTRQPIGSGGRSRSLSAPQQPNEDILQQLQKRRGSMNAPLSTASTPNEQVQPVSRSNSGKSRSFFSSLSSKFKLSSFSGPSSDKNGLKSSPFPDQSPLSKLNSMDFLPSFTMDQDLSSFVTRPPQDIGMPSARISRRSSVSSSPRLSVDKEKGSFFKRRSLTAESAAPLQKTPASSSCSSHKSKPNKSEGALEKIPEKLLRRVAFALDKLEKDPQQQIPSRRPRKGNVLIPEDLKAPVPRLAQGISTSDGARANNTLETSFSERELQIAIEAQKLALLESEKHALEAHLSAKKLHSQIASYKLGSKGAAVSVEDDEIEQNAEKIEIDKPVHYHEFHFEETADATPENSDEELSLEAIYTRCCHLREILPIPATLKQLKNKTKPLQILKLLNPKPTLIDVLSFSDFISITPINTVIFDNVTMTTEMLKHLLSGLVYSKSLEKLSLRNVAMDDKGWLYLCEFLSKNHSVRKLDISQQRVKNITQPNTFRSAMDWNLMIKAIKRRNGIEELVMGGCKLSDEMFKSLLEKALTISTCRLGVAGTEINVRKCELLADWISRPDSKCVGIDIAYNDLSNGQLQPFIKALTERSARLIFFSLNSTSLIDVEEVGQLLKALANVPTLRFLDMSSLPQLFPEIISKLGKRLPHFESLKRIHFDLNELTSESITALADIFPTIKTLVHVSLVGNRNLDRSSIGSLYTAVKSSSIFNVDLDYDLVPDELSHRLALYLMRNLDKTIRPDINNLTGDVEQEDVMFDGSLLMETAEKMLMESDKLQGEVDLNLQRIITNALIKRTNSLRKEMHQIIDKLFLKRNSGQLSFEGKENLLRFCLLDASLEKVVHMFEQKAKTFTDTSMSPTPSINGAEIPTINEVSHSNAGGDREQLHESSKALIDAGPILMAKSLRQANLVVQDTETLQPHLVVIDAISDGRSVPVDNLTGRPVLMKSVSQTSMHAKEQEEEEGEFLRWGHYMEHRDSAENVADRKTEDPKQGVPVLAALPSGSELREAIIDAKGVDSVQELISKINNQRVSLENIYNARNTVRPEANDSTASEGPSALAKLTAERDSEDTGSIDSSDETGVHPVVDEAYDKLLNEAQRVRSNKQE